MRKLNNINIFILTILFSALIVSCDKNENNSSIPGVVELYLLDSYETVENSHQIIESSVVTKTQPLISYAEFITYNTDTYVFKITDSITVHLESLQDSIAGKPFAIKANNVVIYTGYFWPGYISSMCDWVVIDPIMIDHYGGLKVELGYPGLMDDFIIPDKRNDTRILEIFKRDHKLIQ